MQHPRQSDVGGVPRLAARPLETVLAHGGPADDVERPGGHWSSASSSTTVQTSS